MKIVSSTHRLLLIFIFMCIVLSPAITWPQAEHRARGWSDRNGETPRAQSGDVLEWRLDTADVHPGTGPPYGNFKIYYNSCGDTGCTNDEEIGHNEVEQAAHFMECAWALYLNEEMAGRPDIVFDNPLFSVWLNNPDDPTTTEDNHVPVWINRYGNGASGSKLPRNTYPAHSRLYDDVTNNAIHEIGHVVVKAYGEYILGGYVQLFNEGLPTFFEYTLRDDIRYNDEDCSADRFIDLARHSLRRITTDSGVRYCKTTPFWHFIASFSNLRTSEYYDAAELIPACTIYLSAITDPSTLGQMRRIPGRDVIHTLIEKLGACYPNGAERTPVCTSNNGCAASCAHRYGFSGCKPADSCWGSPTDPETTQGRGELMMPIAMDIIDSSFWDNGWSGPNPRFRDGVDHVIFRQYLEHNYEQPGAAQSTHRDDRGFLLRSFCAHYHEIDISNGNRTIYLHRGEDLPKWAYGVFYKEAGRMSAVAGWDDEGYRATSGWDDEGSAVIRIPEHPRFDTAVVVVTAFEGTYNPFEHHTYGESGGHYRFLTERDTPLMGDFDHDGFSNELALYSEHTGLLFIGLNSEGLADSVVEWSLPQRGEIPIVGDFCGMDTRVDDAVLFEPASHTWRIDLELDGSVDHTVHPWANPGDLPIAADVDCDGIFDIGVFRPSTNAWFFDTNRDAVTDVRLYSWGSSGDVPIAGDFDSDGCVDDIAVFRPSSRRWYYNYNRNHPHYFDNVSDESRGPWAFRGDTPLAGDFGRLGGFVDPPDGEADDVVVLRRRTGSWFVDINHNASTDWSVPE